MSSQKTVDFKVWGKSLNDCPFRYSEMPVRTHLLLPDHSLDFCYLPYKSPNILFPFIVINMSIRYGSSKINQAQVAWLTPSAIFPKLAFNLFQVMGGILLHFAWRSSLLHFLFRHSPQRDPLWLVALWVPLFLGLPLPSPPPSDAHHQVRFETRLLRPALLLLSLLSGPMCSVPPGAAPPETDTSARDGRLEGVSKGKSRGPELPGLGSRVVRLKARWTSSSQTYLHIPECTKYTPSLKFLPLPKTVSLSREGPSIQTHEYTSSQGTFHVQTITTTTKNTTI